MTSTSWRRSRGHSSRAAGFFNDTIDPIALARMFKPTDWHEFDDGTPMLESRTYDYLRG